MGKKSTRKECMLCLLRGEVPAKRAKLKLYDGVVRIWLCWKHYKEYLLMEEMDRNLTDFTYGDNDTEDTAIIYNDRTYPGP